MGNDGHTGDALNDGLSVVTVAVTLLGMCLAWYTGVFF